MLFLNIGSIKKGNVIMSGIHYENHMPLLMRITIGGLIFVLIKVNDSQIADYIDNFARMICNSSTLYANHGLFLKR